MPNKKLNPNGHGKIIDLDYVRYALRDTQTTWECFDALAKKVEGLKLADTGLYDLFSEASLGKAYLKTMGIKPWPEMQPNFPAKTIGQIMGTYYGGGPRCIFGAKSRRSFISTFCRCIRPYAH